MATYFPDTFELDKLTQGEVLMICKRNMGMLVVCLLR